MRVVFAVTVETEWGDSVAICGDRAETGRWRPDDAHTLATDPSRYPVWSGDLDVADVLRPLEFKVVRRRAAGGVEWEPLEKNRKLITACFTFVRVGCSWGSADVQIAPEIAKQPAQVCSSSPPPMLAEDRDAVPLASAPLGPQSRSLSWSGELRRSPPASDARWYDAAVKRDLADRHQPLFMIPGSIDMSWPPSLGSSRSLGSGGSSSHLSRPPSSQTSSLNDMLAAVDLGRTERQTIEVPLRTTSLDY